MFDPDPFLVSRRCARRSRRAGLRLAEAGFTLIEAMIVVAVIALLAAVALPAYNDYTKRGTLSEAFGIMTSYSLQLGQFYQDNRTFVAACSSVGLPSSAHFSYSCPTQAATGYVIQAQALSGSNVAGFTFTLDNSGARATTAAPTGWPTNSGCWVSNRAGACQ